MTARPKPGVHVAEGGELPGVAWALHGKGIARPEVAAAKQVRRGDHRHAHRPVFIRAARPGQLAIGPQFEPHIDMVGYEAALRNRPAVAILGRCHRTRSFASEPSGEEGMPEWGWYVVGLAAYYAVMRWVLPKLGVAT